MRMVKILVLCLLSVSVVLPVSAISDEKKNAVVEHCEAIKDSLKNTQRTDARTRVYLGGFYETILADFVTPLNVRLVENNLSSADFVENQNKIADTKVLFANDFVSYQQDLEELVGMSCEQEPEVFYDRLVRVKQKRKIVEQDVLKMRSLISEHVKLANQLKGKL